MIFVWTILRRFSLDGDDDDVAVNIARQLPSPLSPQILTSTPLVNLDPHLLIVMFSPPTFQKAYTHSDDPQKAHIHPIWKKGRGWHSPDHPDVIPIVPSSIVIAIVPSPSTTNKCAAAAAVHAIPWFSIPRKCERT